MSKSTAHRLLKTLEECGLVFQDPLSLKYFLGPLIIKLSSDPTLTHQHLILCAYDEMRFFTGHKRRNRSNFLPISTNKLCLEEIDTTQSIKYIVEKGASFPFIRGVSRASYIIGAPQGQREKVAEKNDFYKAGTEYDNRPEGSLEEIRCYQEKRLCRKLQRNL